MIAYLDTSVVVAAVTNEANTVGVRRWLDSQPAGELAVSAWTVAEMFSALSAKCRSKIITAPEYELIIRIARRLIDESTCELEITRGDFETAARWSAGVALGLRAGDALHLAVAMRNSARLITGDRQLAEAANRLGAETQLL